MGRQGIRLLSLYVAFSNFYFVVPLGNFIEYKPLIHCNDNYVPPYCGLPGKVPLSDMATIADFDRCGPGALEKDVRNFFWTGAGRKVTYHNNFKGFTKWNIVPMSLVDVSRSRTSVKVLNKTIDFPVGLSPVAAQRMINKDIGENASALAVSKLNTIMISSMVSTVGMEQLMERKGRRNGRLWIQVYILKKKNELSRILRRAERAGFEAVVMTADSPIIAEVNCRSRDLVEEFGLEYPNLPSKKFDKRDLHPGVTFEEIRWLKRNTFLPIVAKGMFNSDDAQSVIQAGASAILLSTHGGRQLDDGRSSIEALTDVVDALKFLDGDPEVYLDSGVRSGQDVFKALALGAKAVFVGRPAAWGLAIGGEEGVEKVLTLFRDEFHETMKLAGVPDVEHIFPSSVVSTKGTDNSDDSDDD